MVKCLEHAAAEAGPIVVIEGHNQPVTHGARHRQVMRLPALSLIIGASPVEPSFVTAINLLSS
jgi:hypothetical protein